MRLRNLVILCFVVAAVAAYIFIHERHQMATVEKRERADRVFPQLEQERVDSLEIRNSHGTFRLAKDSGEWRLVEPIDFPADSATVNGLIRSIENLEAARTLSTDEVDLAAYGLDDPQLAVVLETDDGSRFALSVGDETALGSNRAVRRGDEPTIVLGSGWWVADLDKELDQWRSRSVVDVVTDDVESVDLVAGADLIRLNHDEGGWTLVEPIRDLANQDHVGNLISDLNALRIEEFLDPAADPEALGLVNPAYGLTITRSGGEPPIRLEFGVTREVEGSTQVACRRGDRELFWVTDRAMTRLTRAPVRWRASKIFQFDTWDAEGLTVTAGDTVSLTRSEGIWETADGTEVDHTAVQRRLTALADLEAAEFDLIEPATEVMGEIQLTLPGDGEDASPRVVAYTFRRPFTENGQAIVVVSARDTVMTVDAAAAEEILSNPRGLLKAEGPTDADEEPPLE